MPNLPAIGTSKMSQLPFSRISERLAAPTSDVWKVHYEALARKDRGEDILLLHHGRLIERAPAPRFFDAPETEIAREFAAGRLTW